MTILKSFSNVGTTLIAKKHHDAKASPYVYSVVLITKKHISLFDLISAMISTPLGLYISFEKLKSFRL